METNVIFAGIIFGQGFSPLNLNRPSVWHLPLISSSLYPHPLLLGMMCYPGTELWVPVLYGMEIPDPQGSGLMVPILGMENDGKAADATLLAGSMEDANGKGKRELGDPESPRNVT